MVGLVLVSDLVVASEMQEGIRKTVHIIINYTLVDLKRFFFNDHLNPVKNLSTAVN